MKPRQRSLHDPTVSTQPASVGCAATCNLGINSSGSKLIAMRLGVVSSVGVQPIGAASRTPGLPRTGGIASTKGISCPTSAALAPVNVVASGMPPPSVITWCLLPGFERSVGFGPVFSPPPRARQRRTVNNRTRPVDAVGAVDLSQQRARAGPARHRPRASRAVAASKSYRCHSPSPGAGLPSRCRS